MKNKIQLDGPDGSASGMICGEEQIPSKRQQGGGSLMVWAGFGNSGKINLAFPTG